MKSRFVFVAAGATLFLGTAVSRAQDAGQESLGKQIFNTMLKVHGVQAGFRPVHARGIVCQGSFQPTPEAAKLSIAPHFHGPVSVTVRFSAGSPDPMIPFNSPQVGPRGFAIRFASPTHDADIVAMSHNGFVVGSGEEFLELQKAIAATDPSKPHPWPIEGFLGAHPRALKFVTDNAVIPASFATEAFFSNDAFVFVNKEGAKQPGRFKIIPFTGEHNLTSEEAAAKSADFLADDLKSRLAKKPVKYHLIIQMPNPGDVTADPSVVWPEDRKTVEVGTITITAVVPDSAAAEKELAFDPTNLPDGIELSDDLLPALRSEVYGLSSQYRQEHQK